MKKLLLLFSVFGILNLMAQQVSIQPANHSFQYDFPKNTIQNKAGNCSDTLLYVAAKSTSNPGILVNSATSAKTLAQYFYGNDKQDIEVTGFYFYAYADTTVPMEVYARIWAAKSDTTVVPGMLAQDTVTVQPYVGGPLNTYKVKVTFANPVVINNPNGFIVGVTNLSPKSIVMYCNNWSSNDGDFEWCSNIQIGNTWSRSYNVNVGGAPFNADALIEPFVSYTPKADFVMDTACIANGSTVRFTSDRSLIASRMYNYDAFYDIQKSKWDFGDGSPMLLGSDTTHTYAVANDYQVVLYDTLTGWYGASCEANDTDRVVTSAPVSGFTHTTNGDTAFFTNTSTNADTYLWDFGDGNTSTDVNPIHVYASTGNYIVTLVATNGCGGVINGNAVNISNVGVNNISVKNLYTIYPNPSTGNVLVKCFDVEINKIEVYNNIGQIIKHINVSNRPKTININNLNNGNYFIKVYSTKGVGVNKLQVIK